VLVVRKTEEGARELMQALHDKLRCSACGPLHISIRIAYTGAGGFHYGMSANSE
jgi:hypothetical protein